MRQKATISNTKGWFTEKRLVGLNLIVKPVLGANAFIVAQLGIIIIQVKRTVRHFNDFLVLRFKVALTIPKIRD